MAVCPPTAELGFAWHRYQEVLRLLEMIDTRVSQQLQVHRIADSYQPEVRAWLAKRPRFHLHSTHLQLVARPAGAVVPRADRQDDPPWWFGGVEDLVAVIEQYQRVHNDEPKPFVRIANAESILTAKVRYGHMNSNK